MELKNLLGLHELSGVDIRIEKVKQLSGDCDYSRVLRFVLNGKTYRAIEDIDAGTRSYCKNLNVCYEKVSNMFPTQKVMGKIKGDELCFGIYIVQFTDMVTNNVLLEFGTTETKEFNPVCVMNWYPKNLSINIGN